MQELTVIEPGGKKSQYWLELWNYRELFRVLAWRDLSIRYKQTLIGAAWAVIRPVLTVLVFTLIFGRLAKLPSDGSVPYPLLVFAGMLPWTFFSSGLAEASNSLINNANLIGKVYFPRMIVPAATLGVAFVDFLISFVILIVLMAWFKLGLSWHMAWLPGFVALSFFASLGPSLWVTAVNVKYRDFRYVIPFLLQFGLYISPVGFSSRLIPDGWRLLYSLNPIVGVIDGFRWCMFGEQSPMFWPGLALSCASTALLLWLGVSTFRRMESAFADLI